MDIEVLEGGLPSRSPTVVKVLGAGGGGSNAVNRMIEYGIKNVDFIAVNTDTQALDGCRAPVKLPIGRKTTQGLGAGGKPEVGKEAALADEDMIKNALSGANMVFITAGMGGGTGTGSAPVIAALARQAGALTVGVVTTPFGFEGRRRMRIADEGINELRKTVDTIIIIPNANLMKLKDKSLPIIESFRKADDVLREGIEAISEIITRTGEINIDFADVRAAMKDQGDALLGIGTGTGVNRAADAANAALNNPLYDTNSIEGASHVLINAIGGPDFSLEEFEKAVTLITEKADEDADIKPGYAIDTAMEDRVQVTVIATGFHRGGKAQQNTDEAKPPAAELFTENPLDVDYHNVFTKTPSLKNPGQGADQAPGQGSYRPALPLAESDLNTPTCVRNGLFHLVTNDSETLPSGKAAGL